MCAQRISEEQLFIPKRWSVEHNEATAAASPFDFAVLSGPQTSLQRLSEVLARSTPCAISSCTESNTNVEQIQLSSHRQLTSRFDNHNCELEQTPMQTNGYALIQTRGTQTGDDLNDTVEHEHAVFN